MRRRFSKLAGSVAAVALLFGTFACTPDAEGDDNGNGGGMDATSEMDTTSKDADADSTGGDSSECLTQEEAMHLDDYNPDKAPKCCPPSHRDNSCLISSCTLLTCIQRSSDAAFRWYAVGSRCTIPTSQDAGDAGSPCPPIYRDTGGGPDGGDQ